MHPSFDDRTVTLDAPEQLADLGAVLAARSRLEILRALMKATEPLSINEVARRVGIDASPARSHLEALAKEGLVREVDETGRARRFSTSLQQIKVTLEGVERAGPAPAGSKPPREVKRLQAKLDGYAKDIAKLEEKARRVKEEMRKVLEKPAKKGEPAP